MARNYGKTEKIRKILEKVDKKDTIILTNDPSLENIPWGMKKSIVIQQKIWAKYIPDKIPILRFVINEIRSIYLEDLNKKISEEHYQWLKNFRERTRFW